MSEQLLEAYAVIQDYLWLDDVKGLYQQLNAMSIVSDLVRFGEIAEIARLVMKDVRREAGEKRRMRKAARARVCSRFLSRCSKMETRKVITMMADRTTEIPPPAMKA